MSGAGGQDRGAARLWLRILSPSGGRIGPGMIALLKAVSEHGSISAAARALGMSYRRAWLLVEQAAQAAGAPVVETSTGGAARGGAALTLAGTELIALYDRLEARANADAQDELAAFFDRVRAGGGSS